MSPSKNVSASVQDVLTSQQYADKLQIGRSTLFSWLANGILVEGIHYFRVGRVIRFIGNNDAIVRISGNRQNKRQHKLRSPAAPKKALVNWEY